jgi:hypothetical protein
VPFSTLQLQDITLELDVEFQEKDTTVLVGFPRENSSQNGINSGTTKPNARITMKINLMDKPAGLSTIIEGYDKNLRAQIPG